MKIYFLARFDLCIQMEAFSVVLKSGEMALLDEMCDGSILVKSMNNNLDSYAFKIKECLKSKCCYIGYYVVDIESILIELKPKHIYSPTNKRTQAISFNGKIFLIELCYGSLVKIDCPDKSYYINKSNLLNFDYDIKKCYKDLLFLTFKFDACDHQLVFSEEKLLINDTVKEINIKDDHLIMLIEKTSCFGQMKVVDIDLKEGTDTSYFVYTDDRKVFKELDIRYLFLDAVMINNFNLCEQYLSAELKDIGEEFYFEFFQDFEEYRFIENACVLEKNNEVIKIVHFEVFDNKIVNIYD